MKKKFVYKIINIETRKKNLQTLNSLLEKEKESICKALYLDLHKPNFESYYLEIKQVQHDIQTHLDNLDKWLKQDIFIHPIKYLTISLTGYGKAEIEHKPRGNVLIIGAWNYPINLSLQPLVGSISAGNISTVVFPSLKYTKHTSNLMMTLFDKYFKNNSSVYTTIGGKENINNLLQKKWDFIFYTGSSSVGKIIYQKASQNLTPVVLELGGKSPCIIDKQYNMDLLIKRLLWGKLTNCGQTCICPDYFLVDEKFGNEFIKLLIQYIKCFYGNNIKQTKDYGRIVNNRAFKRLLNIIEQDIDYIEYGGNYDEKELFIEPTIINFKDDKEAFFKSFSMKDEIFGPIIPIYYFKNENEIYNIIEKYSEPLVAYLFTKKWKNIESNIKAGTIVINDTLIQMNSPLPFGGIGKSGIGKYHGKYSFDVFSYQRSKLIRYNFGEIPARFPPYGIYWKKMLLKISQLTISVKYIDIFYWLSKNLLICLLYFKLVYFLLFTLLLY
jgi:aldehyde dehydrogenase (NAD+)